MARQRYYGEKFKPTKGAFGNKSKYQKSLERQVELRKQIGSLFIEIFDIQTTYASCIKNAFFTFF